MVILLMAILALVFLFNIGTLSNIGIWGTALADEQPAPPPEEGEEGHGGGQGHSWLGTEVMYWYHYDVGCDYRLRIDCRCIQPGIDCWCN